MKYLKSVLLAASLLAPALTGFTNTASASASAYAEQQELEDAAGALGYRARLALAKVQELSTKAPSSDLSKAIRLSRSINVEANEILALIQSDASDDEILDELQVIEDLVLQLDATKRSLLSRYPTDTQLKTSLNDVRRTYFYLKLLLTGSV